MYLHMLCAEQPGHRDNCLGKSGKGMYWPTPDLNALELLKYQKMHPG